MKGSNYFIPKIIHQIWLGPNPPPTQWMKTWKEMNPDWEYCLWNEQNIPELYNQKQYQLMQKYDGKADILRLEILYQYGGIYIDADCECIRPLDLDLLRHKCFAIYENEEYYPELVANGIIGSVRRHPFIRQLMQSISRIKDLNADEAWVITGPMLFTKELHRYTVFHKNIAILPSFTFLPTHHSGIEYKGTGKVYARHHWHSTKIREKKP